MELRGLVEADRCGNGLLRRASWTSVLWKGWRPLKGGTRGQGELLGTQGSDR